MISGIFKSNIISRAEAGDLPDTVLHMQSDNPPSDVYFTDKDPKGAGKLGQLVYNKSTDTLWIYSSSGWKKLALAGGGGDLDPTTWQGIRNIVRAGKAQEYFNIGDDINIAKYTAPTDGEVYDLPLKVVDFGTAELENGQIVPSMKLITAMMLDAYMPLVPVMKCKVTNVSTGAEVDANAPYMRWDWSVNRQWLNSEGSNWYHDYWTEAINEGSLTPDMIYNGWSNPHDLTVEDVSSKKWFGYKGFLSCISADLASVLTPTKVSTVIWGADGKTDVGNTVTYDKATLMSAEQMYMMSFYEGGTKEETATREGGYLEWFKRQWLALGKTAMRDYGGDCRLDAQLFPQITDPEYLYAVSWTRTSSKGFTNHTSTGGWGNTRANELPSESKYVRPLITIC